MNEKKMKRLKEESVLDFLEEQYLEDENKAEIDYWAPLSKLIIESVELRDSKGMSQSDLADLMKTKQSVISRFENMGRLPNYDFIARLSSALGHSPGMTLYGDYMALVPHEQQPIIKQLAEKGNLSTKTFVQRILDQSIAGIPIKTNASSADCGTVSILANKPLTVFISSADPLLEDPKGTADQLKADLALAS